MNTNDTNNELIIDGDIADNEHGSINDVFVYDNAKPTAREIEQLRFIKNQRKNAKLVEVKTDYSHDDINQLVLKYSHSRNKNRIEILNLICNRIIDGYKQIGLTGFPRSYVTQYCECLKNERTQQRVTTEILNYMVDVLKTLKIIPITKKVYSFRNKDLRSADCDSYSSFMNKNGYKRYIKKGLKSVGKFAINEELPDNEIYNPLINENVTIWDNSEIKSYKPIEKQGCFNNGRFSVVKGFSHYTTKDVYVLI